MKPVGLFVLFLTLRASVFSIDLPVEREILFGADYELRPPGPIRELFFETGLNCVRLTGGGYGWSVKNHTEWAKLLAERGVKVYLQLGSHYPTGEYFDLKDAWLVDQDGKTGVVDKQAWAINYSGSCWPQLSYAHPGFREMLAKDFTAYLANFPPSPSLAGVILHNEPGMHWNKDRLFDYSEASIKAFRGWLPTQHADIATLNKRWGSDFKSFTEVTAPIKREAAQLAPWMDWRRFQVFQIAEFMRWEAGFAKSLRPDLARTTNLDGPLNNWYSIRVADIEAYSRAMDTVGIDIYPAPWTDFAFVPYAVDQLQGVAQGRKTHVLECEVYGDRAKDWKHVDAEGRGRLLRSELWTMFGHGVDGVLMWGFSRGDSFSLTDGDWNPRVLVCRDIVSQINMIGLGRFHRPPSQVAICLDPDTYIRAGALDGGSLSGGSALDATFHGVHAALAAAGIQSDVILGAQLPQITQRYRAIILPASTLIDASTLELLCKFVADGGTLIAFEPFAEMTRWGAPYDLKADRLAKALLAAKQDLEDSTGTSATEQQKSGAGRFVLLPADSGQRYLSNPLDSLPAKFATLLAGGGVTPAVKLGCNGTNRPDVSLLVGGSDRLIVVAGQSNHAAPIVPVDEVTLEVVGVAPKAVFAFPPTCVNGGIVSSGPRELVFENSDAGCRVTVGRLESALPLLLTTGRPPLLSLAMPAQAKCGEKVSLSVTCHNPSDTEINGAVELQATGLSVRATVKVPAWGRTDVVLDFVAPAETMRLPVGAKLTTERVEVKATPVDLQPF